MKVAQAEVAVQKMCVQKLMNNQEKLVFDLQNSKRSTRELAQQLQTMKTEHAAALARETQRLTDYYELDVIADYQALIDRHRLLKRCMTFICAASI